MPALSLSGFISYAHADAKMVLKLRNHLVPIEQKLGIAFWTDDHLETGKPWDAGIRAAMDRTSLFVFCISAEALASTYIRETEMAFARGKHDRGEALVVPVILKDVAWSWVPWLSELQAVPRHAKPIQIWRPTNSGYADAADRIGRMVRDRIATGAV